MKRLLLFMPLLVFAVMAIFLLRGLENDPAELPSALVNQPFPPFKLQALRDSSRMLSEKDFQGEVVLVNVWATWCFACRIEHPMLNRLSEEGVKIIGLNYKDERNAAIAWLAERGDPYQFNIFDLQGSLGIDLGVYGAPETYLVDAEGVIRHRRVGVVDERVWEQDFLPLYEQLSRH